MRLIFKFKFQYIHNTNFSKKNYNAVHCEWHDWMLGECSKSCGGGMLTKTRKEKVAAQHGGEECPGVDTIEESCNVQECPGN